MVKRTTDYKRILLVDDDQGVLRAARSLLEVGGYQVQACASVREALDAYGEGKFDLVLTDLTMPELSGWEFARELKRRAPKTPVFVITGWGIQADPKRMKENCVDGILPKPFMLDDLSKAIKGYKPR